MNTKLDALPCHRASSASLMVPVCPKCDAALLIVHLNDVEVDVCEHCRGVWLDAGELEQLGGVSTENEVVDERTKYLCPRCDNHMRQVKRHGIALEECVHGLWFDASELPQLVKTNGPLAAQINNIFRITK